MAMLFFGNHSNLINVSFEWIFISSQMDERVKLWGEKVSNESKGDTPMEYSNLSESFFNFL